MVVGSKDTIGGQKVFCFSSPFAVTKKGCRAGRFAKPMVLPRNMLHIGRQYAGFCGPICRVLQMGVRGQN